MTVALRTGGASCRSFGATGTAVRKFQIFPLFNQGSKIEQRYGVTKIWGQIFTLDCTGRACYESGMARPLRINDPGALYHVTCRGNERRLIYRDRTDYHTFLDHLQISLDTYGVLLHAYVLMSNHFHLIVEVPRSNLSEFMRHLNITYTGYFNRRHRRVGHLYQGRFKAIMVDADAYLLELSRYVHLNPVRLRKYEQCSWTERLRVLQSYRWSSLRGYLHVRMREPFVVSERVLGYVGGDTERGRQAYGRFVQEGVRSGVSRPWGTAVGQVVLGREEFVERFRSRFRSRVDRERPAIRALNRMTPERVIHQVCRALGWKKEALRERGGGWKRALVMDCLYRYSGLTQRDIGERMGGIGYSRVSRARKDLRLVSKEQPAIGKVVGQVEAALENQK
jgi:REP-associated tyrosine transposase